jgi:uroporphyrin-III C-methyltransferase
MLAENVSRPEQTLLRDSMQVLAERLENDVSSAPGLILYGSLAGAP